MDYLYLPPAGIASILLLCRGDANILISPATVEMAGLFVVPLEKDFKKVTFADLEKVWEEVSITEDEENELIRKIRDEV